jgi:hypothetical protein
MNRLAGIRSSGTVKEDPNAIGGVHEVLRVRESEGRERSNIGGQQARSGSGSRRPLYATASDVTEVSRGFWKFWRARESARRRLFGEVAIPIGLAA